MVDNVTADRLAEMIDAGDRFTLIDTRPEANFEAWHVRVAKNVPHDPSQG